MTSDTGDLRTYDATWVLAVLEDLTNFCQHNRMPHSRSAIEAALTTTRLELGGGARDITPLWPKIGSNRAESM